jgi:hypothetical protein
MKFAYFEVVFSEESNERIPGSELSRKICAALGGNGPFPRDDYGWEWMFQGNNYRAHAVLQKYDCGWLIPVKVRFIDMVFNRGASVLTDLTSGVERALGNEVNRILKFESEKDFRESGI